jgi:hypothetical protein
LLGGAGGSIGAMGGKQQLLRPQLRVVATVVESLGG